MKQQVVGAHKMKFWIWWFAVGIALTVLGFFCFSLTVHSGGPIFWIGNILLPGMWLSSLAKPILPNIFLASSSYLWGLVFVTQMALWYVAGFVVLRLREERES